MSRSDTAALSIQTPCPGCSGTSVAILWRHASSELDAPVDFDVVRCLNCDLAYTSPMPSHEQLMPFYNSGVYAKDERRAPRVVDRILSILADIRLREIEAWKRPGRLLDVGSGKGRFVWRAEKRGWTARGVEPVPGAVRLARSRYGADVVEGTLTEAKLPARSFDVVTMWHVLEHVPNPRAELLEVSRVLAEDGLLVLEVPNFASLQAWIGQDRWFHLMLPHHLIHFTPHTLRAVLADAGFGVTKLRSYSPEHGPFGMLQSILNRFGGERDFLFHRLKRVPHRGGRTASAASMAATLLGGTFGIVPAAIAESAAAWTGHGGTIRVLARKR